MSNIVEDNKLIADFLKGNNASFDKIVLKYKDIVFNVSLRMLNNREDALDVSQDIFVKLYSSLKNFRQESKLSTYLYRMTVNFCKNKLIALSRKQKRYPFSIDTPISTKEGQMSREFAHKGPNPRDILDSKENKIIVEEALSLLKSEYKEILILKEIEGLKYEEITDVLSINIGTVKSRLNRARGALKEKLERIL